MLCYAMLCYAMLYYYTVLLYYTIIYYTMLYYTRRRGAPRDAEARLSNEIVAQGGDWNPVSLLFLLFVRFPFAPV